MCVVRAIGAELARYGAVGITNTLFSAACYALLVFLGSDAVAAATVAFALGSVNGFLWNRRWTFAGREAASPIRYVAVQAAGLAVTDVLIGALDPALGPAIAYLLTTGTVTLATFAANRRFSFPGTVHP